MRTEEAELTVISLGAGVQSSVMALMAAEGLIKPMPDYAIFADSGWEPQGVYEHLAWLETQLPFPVRRVQKRNLRDDLLAGVNHTGHAFHSIPVFIRSTSGETGVAKRQCTTDYKLEPIFTGLRDLLGLGYGQPMPRGMWVELWIGISRDEVIRMKPSRNQWIENYWPLIEHKMTRTHCKEWFEKRHPGRVLPRSACIGCPYRTNSEWADMKNRDPESWADAILIDQSLRSAPSAQRFDGEVYLHNSRTPLAEVTFASVVDEPYQPTLFGDECEGMCGV